MLDLNVLLKGKNDKHIVWFKGLDIKGCISKVNVFYSSCYNRMNLKALLNEEKVSSYIRQQRHVKLIQM